MKRFALVFGIVFLFFPYAVQAYVPSPQHGAFELKFGPYTPNVDDEPGLTEEVYKNTFEDGTMFLTLLELDWQFLRVPGGTLGVGGEFGFMQAYTKAKNSLGLESADYTVLNVMPFALLGVIRIDVLADELGIPLVPYFKAGACWYLWWILGGGNVDSDASGGTLGWQLSPGLMLRLDQFDTMSARTFDNEIGVNHSYLFFEFMWAKVEGTDDDNMYLSPTDLSGSMGTATFLIGLALEF